MYTEVIRSRFQDRPGWNVTPDVDRLAELYRWALKQDERRMRGLSSEWRQTVYMRRASCGTACCIAGKTALDAGWQPAVARGMHDVIVGWQALADELGIGGWESAGSAFVHPDGAVEYDTTERVARNLLGLTENQASDLFAAGNTIHDLRAIMHRLGVPSDELPLPPSLTE